MKINNVEQKHACCFSSRHQMSFMKELTSCWQTLHSCARNANFDSRCHVTIW